MFQEVSSLDQRLAELQSQLDRLAASLQLWREQHDHLEPAEQRLADLTRQCTDIVAQWSTTNERQARAVRQLEDRVSSFSAAEERLHNDTSERLRALERVIEQEWTALRQMHRAPVEELKEHAATLGQISVAAANTSLSGIERAEARLEALERTLNDRLSGVSRQLETAVAEIRALVPGRGAETLPPSWPIEGVMRLHNQLRDPSAGGVITVQPSPAPGASIPWALPPAPSGAASSAPVHAGAGRTASRDRIDDGSDDRESSTAPAPESSAPIDSGLFAGRRTMIVAGAIAAVVIVLAAIGSFAMQRQARAAVAQAAQAQQQAQAAVAMATSQVAAARDEAAREVAQAREGSAKAQMVSDVLASPDLIRFNIAGQGPGAITGQVLFSRSRGVVFSGLRVPPAPARMTYQLWLLTDGAPVTAGTFTPDANGRVTFSTEPPRIPRAVFGAALTLEPAGGSATPSDRLLGQNRARPAPAAAAAPAPVTPQ